MPTDKQIYKKEQKQKAAIINSFQSPDTFLKEVDKLDVPSVNDPLRLSSDTPPVRKLYTNTALDRILSIRGGIAAGRSVELFGEFATGKTQIINTMLIESDGLCVLVDSEDTFDPDRFIELCEARGKDPEEVNKKLLLFQPKDWMEQVSTIRNLPQFDSKGKYLDIGLVAVDSLMKLFGQAPELSGRSNLAFRQATIGQMLATLRTYAKRHNSILAFTSQIRSRPIDTRYAAPEDKISSQGGATVSHEADYRVFLRKGPRNIRYARLIDSIDLPLMEVPFILDVSGIRDLKDPAERMKAMEMAGKYGEKFLSGQVSSVKAAKKYYADALRLGAITPEEAKEYMKEEDILSVLSEIDASLTDQKKPSLYDVDEDIQGYVKTEEEVLEEDNQE